MSDDVRREEFHFDGCDGRRLFGRRWERGRPSREVVLVHGYAEHSGRYDHVAMELVTGGARVHAYDHQGHGHSSGARGHVRRFSDLLDDLDRVIERVRAGSTGIPLYVLGHSMGGLVVCSWARERRPEVSGLIVSAPALSVPGAAGPARRLALRLLSLVAPRLSMASDLDAQGLSRDPQVVEAYLADPLVHLRMTPRLGAEMFRAMARTAGAGAELRLPTLMLHGSDDPICEPAASRAFADAAPDCSYRSYPGLRHEILNEPERDAVLADVQRWMEEREAGAGES